MTSGAAVTRERGRHGGALDARLDRICIVMMSAIGDAVHVLPVVTALKRHRPACHITWILAPGPATLVRGHPDVDEILLFDKSRGASALLDIRRELARRPFDLVLALQVYLKAGLVTALTRAPVKLGFDHARARDLNWLVTTDRIPPHAPQHVQDQYLEFLDHLGVPHEPLEWRLGPWPHERDVLAWRDARLAEIGGRYAALVIGTSFPRERDWVPERWAAVADALRERYDLRPVLVGGPSPTEAATAAAIVRLARHAPVVALGSGLRRLVALLERASLVISLDTGPMHIAVALGRPVISLVSYNNPKRTGPYRFRDLLVDAYGDPGEEYGIFLEHRSGRMARIGVEDVLAKVEVWRERYSSR
jgi:heptosyltransferase I